MTTPTVTEILPEQRDRERSDRERKRARDLALARRRYDAR